MLPPPGTRFTVLAPCDERASLPGELRAQQQTTVATVPPPRRPS